MKRYAIFSLVLLTSTDVYCEMLKDINFQNGSESQLFYKGSNVSITDEGYLGNNKSLLTKIDGAGHAPFVTEMKFTNTSKTIFFTYHHKVSPATTYMKYRPKHIKVRAWDATNTCYWNATFHWDTLSYGGGTCERDATNLIKQTDTVANAITGTGVKFYVVPTEPFSYKDNKWYKYEIGITANDLGVSNGEFEVWIDGKLFWHVGGIEFRSSNMDWLINQVDLEGYTPGGGSPDIAYSWIDNIKISTKRLMPPDLKH